MSVFEIIIKYHQAFLRGLCVTGQLFLTVSFIGIVVGIGVGWVSKKYKDAEPAIKTIGFVLTCIPVLVFLMWMHYPFQSLFGLVIDPFYTSILTFSIVNIFMVSNLTSKAIESLPEQYLLIAKVNGLSKKQIFLKIELPLLFQQILPSLLMSQVVILHTTLFASLIGVEEIFRVSQQINATIYKPVEIYTALGAFFLAISLPINAFALYLKKKFTRNISER